MKNERAIEELLSEMLLKQDIHTELLTELVKGQKMQTEMLSKMNDRIEQVDENRKMDAIHLDGSLTRLENELRLMRPLLEKALDVEDRLRKLEETVYRKGA